MEAAAETDPPTTISDLPDAVLEAIFSHCVAAAKQLVPVICLVSRRWQGVYERSSIPLPQLSLTAPLQQQWVQRHARRLVKLTLRRCDSIAVLASASSLQHLLLEDCRKLADLSPLTGLGQLCGLWLRNLRSLSDISPVAQLPVLQALGIDRCFVRDLTPLSAAVRLSELHLSYDCWVIINVTFPQKLPSLKRLRLMAALQDLSPLGQYPSLTSLELYAVAVHDLSALTHLTELRELDLHQLQEEQGALDMSPLSTLVNLTSLGLQGSDADIVQGAPWPSLTGLCKLDLHGSRVRDLKPLAVLSRMRSLQLSQARELRDLGPCSLLMGLQELVLTGSRNVRDLRPVLGLTGLMSSGLLKRP